MKFKLIRKGGTQTRKSEKQKFHAVNGIIFEPEKFILFRKLQKCKEKSTDS